MKSACGRRNKNLQVLHLWVLHSCIFCICGFNQLQIENKLQAIKIPPKWSKHPQPCLTLPLSFSCPLALTDHTCPLLSSSPSPVLGVGSYCSVLASVSLILAACKGLLGGKKSLCLLLGIITELCLLSSVPWIHGRQALWLCWGWGCGW